MAILKGPLGSVNVLEKRLILEENRRKILRIG